MKPWGYSKSILHKLSITVPNLTCLKLTVDSQCTIKHAKSYRNSPAGDSPDLTDELLADITACRNLRVLQLSKEPLSLLPLLSTSYYRQPQALDKLLSWIHEKLPTLLDKTKLKLGSFSRDYFWSGLHQFIHHTDGKRLLALNFPPSPNALALLANYEGYDLGNSLISP